MISGIYPYLLSMTVGSLKKLEGSYPDSASSSVRNMVEGGAAKGDGSGIADVQAISLTCSGSVTQGSVGLFIDVAGATSGQELPQTVLSQKGFEAYLKVLRSQDESREPSLDTFA